MKIKSYNMNERVINRYIKEYNIDDSTARLHFKALIDFLVLASKADKPCFPCKTIDDIWHTFILFTRDYYTFCLNNLGKFIHHNPMDDEIKNSFDFTLGYYCYLSNNKMKKKIMRSILDTHGQHFLSCTNGCSGGDCSNVGACSN